MLRAHQGPHGARRARKEANPMSSITKRTCDVDGTMGNTPPLGSVRSAG